MKNWTIRIALTAFVFLGGYSYHQNTIQAQAASSNPLQVTVVGAHTLCTVVSGQTSYCLAADGIWQSIGGAAFTQVGASAGSVVTSFNGKTGDITYAAPVASVNGKTGAVTLTVQ